MIQSLQEKVGERILISWPVKNLPLNIRPVRLRFVLVSVSAYLVE